MSISPEKRKVRKIMLLPSRYKRVYLVFNGAIIHCISQVDLRLKPVRLVTTTFPCFKNKFLSENFKPLESKYLTNT